ncbi:MAG: hypothetical protein ABIQ86_15240 [Steroidobacteraceae bacterium]
MTPLIAMPGPSPVTAPGDRTQALHESPELPVLSEMLQGATRLSATADWRSGVLAALAIPGAASISPAMVSACAIPLLPPGAGTCLAMPVHAVAGISRMFLATAGSFMVDAAEREDFRQAFNAEFGAPDVNLHAAGTGWLLQAPFAVAASDASPELLIGVALAREPARTDAGRSLRRLGAEVEMWLAGLPLNREREKLGAAPINCFWFWGGAVATGLAAPGQLPGGVFSNIDPDAWVAGLASHCATPVRRAMNWDDARDTAGALVILQPPLPGEAVQQMSGWEAAWLEPARRDLAARRLPALRLQIGHSAWQLPGPPLTRWLRRKRPWWQAVSA